MSTTQHNIPAAFVCGLCLFALPVKADEAIAATARPNIVIFLADDAGWGDYSRNGNTQVSTPHIDSIARGGVTLDRFFVCPVCNANSGADHTRLRLVDHREPKL